MYNKYDLYCWKQPYQMYKLIKYDDKTILSSNLKFTLSEWELYKTRKYNEILEYLRKHIDSFQDEFDFILTMKIK